MRRLALMATLLGGGLVGCAAAPPAPAPPPVAPAAVLPDPPVAAHGLAVHLVWAGPADLDLFVTDPQSVTFSGEHGRGVVAADVGCKEAVRNGGGVETARWEAPATGRYRVGVEFAAPCGAPVAVPYRVLVDLDGTRRTTEGTATPLQRTPNAVEVVVP
jgi:hypothetical protein